MSKGARVIRYMVGVPVVGWLFRWQSSDVRVYGLADADHASDEETRRSVSCSQEFFGGHLIDCEAIRQACIALSSGESEFYALILCSARVMVLHSLLQGFGFTSLATPEAYSDSSAARGIAGRSGVGRIKHMVTRHLWLQEARATGRIVIKVIDTVQNTSDLGTKYLDQGRRSVLISMLPLAERGFA